MNRDEYIERLIRLASKKWRLAELEIEEIRLALEMIPDRTITNQGGQPFLETENGKRIYPNAPVVVMYGVGYPNPTYVEPNVTTFTSTSSIDNEKE